MTDVRDAASVLDAAQKAAGESDYPEAERLLREAAAIQEASLGSSHPDLATTLNNLAFVCERMNKFDEAERGYRRAHAIAVASLPPGHPIISTSLENLVDFCAAHEIPIWKPPATAAGVDTPSADDDASSADTDDAAEPPHVGVTKQWPLRTVGAALFGVAAVAAIFLVAQGGETVGTPPSPPEATQESTQKVATVSSTSPETEPAPPRETAAAIVAERRPDPPRGSPNALVTVLNAQLCSVLERRGSPDWQCTPVSGEPGTYLFYTRLLTGAETTVEHRWYHGERVHQVMRLRVTPSPGNGYRTFSGNTISPERAGDWKVELRAADGGLLQEERFVVR